jgi:hypothetical protein
MKNKTWLCLSVMTIVTFALSTQAAVAGPSSPFVGHWEGVDLDGSDIRLTIGGPPVGPFQITWTESYISFCQRGPGLVRGTGVLVDGNPYLMEAELRVECFNLQSSLDLLMTFQYAEGQDTLISTYEGGMRVVFRHPGRPQTSPLPVKLMVNYQEEWVSGFYEADHTVWLTVTESDGVSVKASAEMVTGPQPSWDGGEIGFASQPEQWQPELPDIQPNDWVYAWVDNGSFGQMQVGEISAWVDLESDEVRGTISAGWYGEQVYVYCFLWGGSESRDDLVVADGSDEFNCSWSGAYDIQPGDVAEVQYYGPDGHAVDYYLFLPNTRFTVFPEWNYLEGYEWPDGATVDINVGAKDECTSSAEAGYPDWDPDNTFFSVELPDGCDVAIGDRITVADHQTTRSHTVEDMVVTDVNTETDTVSGTAAFGPESSLLHIWIHERDDSYMELTALEGTWSADFSAFDLIPGMGGRVEMVDIDGDATAIDWETPPAMGLRVNYGHDWVESFYEAGHQVSVTVRDSDDNIKATATAFTEPKEFWGWESGFAVSEGSWDGGITPDLQPGDWVNASVDNGVTAQVQLGDIQGEVVVFEDRISGTVSAPWIGEAVPVECLDWGSGGNAGSQDGGWINPDGADAYSCAWDASVWDIQPWQEIGVGYSTPDGHWVANAFHAEHWMAISTYDLPAGAWQAGEHSYYFEWSYSVPSPGDGAVIEPVLFTVAPDAAIYPGEAVLWSRSFATPLVWNGSSCELAPALNPEQPTRLAWGWVNDFSMTFEQAQDHFDSFVIQVYWDGEAGGSAMPSLGELNPWYGPATSDEYRCALTGKP